MNLAIIIRGIFPDKIGGQEIYGYLLLKNMIKLKNKVAVFTFGNLKIFKKKVIIHSLRPLNIPVIKFFFKIASYVLSFLKYQKKLKIQLIHTNGAISEAVAAILIKKLLKIPVLITLHGGGIYSFARRFPSLTKMILKNSDVIIAINNYLKKLAGRFTSKKITVISNFIDTDRFRKVNDGRILRLREKYNILDGFMVLTVSRLVSTKGTDKLIYSIQEIEKQYPNICLLIIGEGSYKKNLTKLAKSLNLSKKIHFLSEIPNDKLPIYYSAADIFILPSYYEGQPTVILEAMACETPVIATAVGGIPELIKPGYNGFLISKNDTMALKNRILQLISNPELRMQMGKNSRKKIEEKFDATRNSFKIYQNYISILKNFYSRK